MKFIQKYKIIIVFFLLIILKLYLVSELHPYIELNYTYDDSLYFNIINSMKDGNWLGNYNELTLVKGILFPLFVLFLSILKIPYLLGLDILYITSISLLVLSLKKYINNSKWLLVLFALLLFSPISYSSEIYLRFYRNGFNISIILIYFAALINCLDFYKQSFNNKILKILLLSASIIFVFHTREDFYWIIPSLALLIIYNYKNLLKKRNTISLFLIIPLSLFCFNTIISQINYNYYNTFSYNELTNGAFNEAYKTIMNVQGEDKYNRVSLSSSDLKKISDQSPSFKKLYDELYLSNKKNIIDGTLIWKLRTTAGDLGFYNNGDAANTFWTKVNKEIALAFKENRLQKRKLPVISPLISPIRLDYVLNFPKTYLEAIILLSNYSDLEIGNKASFGNDNDIKTFNKITNQKEIINNKPTYIKFIILELILAFYKFLNPLLSITSFILLIKNIKLSKTPELKFLTIILLLSILTNLAGLVYTHLSAFDTLSYYYLSPLYNLVIIFNFINIYLYYKKVS